MVSRSRVFRAISPIVTSWDERNHQLMALYRWWPRWMSKWHGKSFLIYDWYESVNEFVSIIGKIHTHRTRSFTHTQHSEKLLRSVERTAQCLLFAQFEYHLMNSSSIVIIGCVAFCNSHQLINCRLLKILIKFKGNKHTYKSLSNEWPESSK